MKKLLIFLSIFFIAPNVFARDQNVTSKVEAIPSFGGGTFYAVAPASVPVPLYNNLGTRYNGTLSQIEFYLKSTDWDWSYNKTYSISLYMATEDWRNHFMGPQVFRAESNGSVSSNASNMATSSVSFISYKKIKFTFKVGNTMSPYTKFRIYSTNTATTAFTGVSNYNLSSIIISDTTTSTPAPTPVISPTATPQPNNQDIINNQTQNTNSIINNQNQNTQDIVDSQNQNTQDVIDNNNQNTEIVNNSLNTNCKNGPLPLTTSLIEDNNKYLNSSGQLVSDNNAGVSLFLIVKPDSNYHFNFPGGSTGTVYNVCQYGSNKQLLDGGCRSLGDLYSTDLITGHYTQYLRVTIYKSWWFSMSLEGPVCNNWEVESQNKTNEKLDDINNSINNDNVDDKTSFFTNFNNDSHGLTGIITLPLTTIQSLANTSCVALSIPIPFTNSNVSLPCMTQVYQTYIPSVFSIWQVVSFGIISYLICLDIFKMVKGFKDPNDDKVEVLDL